MIASRYGTSLLPYLRAAVYYSLFNYLIVNVAIYIHLTALGKNYFKSFF